VLGGLNAKHKTTNKPPHQLFWFGGGERGLSPTPNKFSKDLNRLIWCGGKGFKK